MKKIIFITLKKKTFETNFIIDIHIIIILKTTEDTNLNVIVITVKACLRDGLGVAF